jgi:hypothetical protein
MVYLVESVAATATFRPYVSVTSPSQTIEFIVTIVRIVSD